MEFSQRVWNQGQKEFRRVLLGFDDHENALELFMVQHGVLHSSALDEGLPYSYQDEILTDLSEEKFRRIPANCEHSIAWNLWHMARIEDVTMNMLVADEPQLFLSDGWFERLKSTARDTGNRMRAEEVKKLSISIDLDGLLDYRFAVGRRTREVVRRLTVDDVKQKVDAQRLQKILDVGAVVHQAMDLIEYWGNRTIAGLLLMPPTRHNCVHLNESMRLKNRRN